MDCFFSISIWFYIDVSDEVVSIQISAPPVDGEANTAIVKYFSELLNLKKADLSLRVNSFKIPDSQQYSIHTRIVILSFNILKFGSVACF